MVEVLPERGTPLPDSVSVSTASIRFHELSVVNQQKHFQDVARHALPLWGYPDSSILTLLNITENATFKVEAPGMPTMAMRVHRLDYAELDSIRTELSWIAHLAGDDTLRVVAPIPSTSGTLVETIETPSLGERRHVVCFEFVPGSAPRGSQDDTATIGRIVGALDPIPDALTTRLFRGASVAYNTAGRISARVGRPRALPEQDRSLYRRLGEIAALIHNRSASWTPPAHYRRIEWDQNATFGPGWNNYYGKHYWDCPLLSPADVSAIGAAQSLMARRLAAFGTGPSRYGMIHSDLRPANLIAGDDGLTVLDFDDCGRGWYLTDIAGIVGFDEHRADLPQLIDAIVEGYRGHRALSDEDAREIPTFILLRRIGLLESLQYHIDNTVAGEGESAEVTPEIAAFYAKGTAILARRYVKRFARTPLPQPADRSGE